MSTLDKDFTSFIADRTGKLDSKSKDIISLHNALPDLPESTQETIGCIESLVTERAYRIGFLDGMSIMAGLIGDENRYG